MYICIPQYIILIMKRSYIFLATGFEEIEALATADILRRANIDVTLVSIYPELEVSGAHGITVVTDTIFDACDFSDAEWLICPGGLPGADNLYAHTALTELLLAHNANGGNIAAICAAPAVVLAPLGIIKGKNATCYPGFEPKLTEGYATPQNQRVVTDGNIITANGPSSATPFALAIVEKAKGKETADEVAAGMLC